MTVTDHSFDAFMSVQFSSAHYHARYCRADGKVCQDMREQGYSTGVVERDFCTAIKPSVPPWDCYDNLNKQKQYQEL